MGWGDKHDNGNGTYSVENLGGGRTVYRSGLFTDEKIGEVREGIFGSATFTAADGHKSDVSAPFFDGRSDFQYASSGYASLAEKGIAERAQANQRNPATAPQRHGLESSYGAPSYAGSSPSWQPATERIEINKRFHATLSGDSTLRLYNEDEEYIGIITAGLIDILKPIALPDTPYPQMEVDHYPLRKGKAGSVRSTLPSINPSNSNFEKVLIARYVKLLRVLGGLVVINVVGAVIALILCAIVLFF